MSGASDAGASHETLSPAIKFVIGLSVSVVASIANAAGLNLLKRDHVRNVKRPINQRRNECGRPMWHAGLYLYVASQVFGSSLALVFLKTQWVAPLASLSLVFNFIFAKWLVGTKITKPDLIGTFVVMTSVVAIVVLGGLTIGDTVNEEDNISLLSLQVLYSKNLFLIYFAIMDISAIAMLVLAFYGKWVQENESRRLANPILRKFPSSKLKKGLGICFASIGGLIASQTLLLGKSAISLCTETINGNNQFTAALPYMICVGLVVTAILQILCLNISLVLADSVIVVPIFYGCYTAIGLINTMVYLDQFDNYEWYILLLIILGMGVLCWGVVLLSSKKPDMKTVEPVTDELEAVTSGSPVNAEGSMNGTATADHRSRTSGSEISSRKSTDEPDLGDVNEIISVPRSPVRNNPSTSGANRPLSEKEAWTETKENGSRDQQLRLSLGSRVEEGQKEVGVFSTEPDGVIPGTVSSPAISPTSTEMSEALRKRTRGSSGGPTGTSGENTVGSITTVTSPIEI